MQGRLNHARTHHQSRLSHPLRILLGLIMGLHDSAFASVWLAVMTTFEALALVRLTVLNHPLAAVVPLLRAECGGGEGGVMVEACSGGLKRAFVLLVVILMLLRGTVLSATLSRKENTMLWVLCASIHNAEAAVFLWQLAAGGDIVGQLQTLDARVFFGGAVANALFFILCASSAAGARDDAAAVGVGKKKD